jgi:hypothetical protein
VRAAEVERDARRRILGELLGEDAQVARVRALAGARRRVVADHAVDERERRMPADRRVLVAAALEADAAVRAPQPVVQPAMSAALDLHAVDLVLVPPERAPQVDRRHELVVGVHPEQPVGAAAVDLVDEHVACLAEVPQLPVAVLVLARRAGVDLRVDRLADRRRRDLERAVGRSGVDQHDAVDDVLDRAQQRGRSRSSFLTIMPASTFGLRTSGRSTRSRCPAPSIACVRSIENVSPLRTHNSSSPENVCMNGATARWSRWR